MPTVKILLGKIGTEWKLWVTELTAENEELQIIGEYQRPVDLLLEAGRENATVVVLSQESPGKEPGVCSHLLLEYPNIVVVLVPCGSGPMVVCRTSRTMQVLEPSKESLGDILLKLRST